MKSTRIYDFTIPANGSFQLPVEGDYFRIMTSTGALEVVTDSMRIGPLRAGQGQENTSYKRMTLNDKSGIVNVGTVLIASSGFIDNRINGDVSVIDGNRNLTMAGAMYIGMAYSPPSGGSRPYTQLWNPAGSNKILVVGKISSSWQGSGNKSLNIYFDTTQFLPTGLVCNKKSGGGVGIGELRQKRDFVAPDYVFGGIWSRFLENNQLFEWKSENGPIIVMPGYGLSVFGDFPDVGLMTGFEWFEESL